MNNPKEKCDDAFIYTINKIKICSECEGQVDWTFVFHFHMKIVSEIVG